MLLRACREYGCLPAAIEELTAHEFMELVAYLKICDDREREALDKAKRDAELKSRSPGRRR